MTVFQMWEDARKQNTLPKEWARWVDFRTWVIANRYKAEYGYKGEFAPDSLLNAIPGYEAKDEVDKTTGKCVVSAEEIATEFGVPAEILAKTPDTWAVWLETNGTVATLKKYAKEMNIELGGARTKREIATLICGGG